jgi:hypothetical protein
LKRARGFSLDRHLNRDFPGLPETSLQSVYEHEGKSFGQAHLREVQGHQAQGRGTHHLHQHAPQAAAGLVLSGSLAQSHLKDIRSS